MKKLVSAIAIACSLMAGAANAADTPEIPAVVVGGAIKGDAEVIAIDVASRTVTLKGEEGQVFDVVVGPKVRNLAQVKVGDRVRTQYARALSVRFKKGPGIRTTEEKNDSTSAAPGEKPGMANTQIVHFVADILSITPKTGEVKIKGASGKIYQVRVKDPKVIADIQAGDQVEGKFVQIFAIGVIPPQASK